MIWWLIYTTGYLFTFKRVFAFIWKDSEPFENDTVDLAFFIFASVCFTLLWPIIWAGLGINKYVLMPLLAELERRKSANL